MAEITAKALFDRSQCEHRLMLDTFGNPSEKDPESAFVQLLQRQAKAQSQKIFGNQPGSLADLEPEERQAETLKLMLAKESHIYGGMISYGNKVTSVDLLRLEESTENPGDFSYVPVVVKTSFGTPDETGGVSSASNSSGANANDTTENSGSQNIDSDTANKICLAVDILQSLDYSNSFKGYSENQHGQTVMYDLSLLRGKRNPTSLWQDYQAELLAAEAIVQDMQPTTPAYSAHCKLCHWQTKCMQQMEASQDLTLIPELGRGKRDAMINDVKDIADFATKDISAFIVGKKTIFKGIGVDTLIKFHERAKLLYQKNVAPYLKEVINLPPEETEIHFDIEVDPIRDFCYLHGFVERQRNSPNHTYIPFFTDNDSAAEEKRIFAGAYQYLQSKKGIPVYYYSSYERTIWKKLARKYPDVCSENDITALFDQDNWIDLYTNVVKSKTEWPVHDHSVKTIAKWLGFKWRDPHPSGAASIEWFDRWMGTNDLSVKDRILEYNEDDCVATGVVLDAIRKLQVKTS